MLAFEVYYNTRMTKTIGRHDMYNVLEPEHATKRKPDKLQWNELLITVKYRIIVILIKHI